MLTRIKRLAERPRRDIAGDEGISLVEVIVALMIFMVVSVGLVYSLTAALRINRDSVDQEVAANLAATEIDAVRSVSDPFTVADKTYSTTVGGKKYTVTRDQGWVAADGSTGNCGTGSTGANLQYKRVNVSVDWVGRRAGSAVATSSTILAPVSRINDPAKGTLLVSVITAAGTGASGVTVTLTPTSGGAAATMAATDSDGCSYGLGLTAGTYTLKISKSGYISADQQTAPTQTVQIGAGSTSSAQFQYDQAATFSLNYASNLTSGTVLKPTTFTTVFSSTYGIYSQTTGMPTTVSLHPFASGYETIAGAYVPATPAGDGVPANAGCLSPDPGQWLASGSKAAGVRSPAVAATPGGTATISIPMGGVKLTKPGSGVTLVATTAAPLTSADPGCSSAQTYTFSTGTNSGDVTLALPYGSWSIYKKSALGALTAITSGLSGGLLGNGPTANVVLLDPRPDA